MSELRCDDCGRRIESGGRVAWRCGCGGPISLRAAGAFRPDRIRSHDTTIWRYREASGMVGDVEPVSLGEGGTPIVSREISGLPCRLKIEFLSPTGSFKDRGASVVVSVLAAAGVTRAVEDSSGNAGAALAAYGSRAGIAMDIIVPDDAPPPKLAAIEACGGSLVAVPGGRAAASAEAMRRAFGGAPFASHVWSPWFLAGTRTLAYEIWEQDGGRPPSRIFLPVGNGSLLLGAFEGFGQLRASGLMGDVPRLMAVQSAACAPLSMPAGSPPPSPGASIADGIRIPAPPRAPRLREALSRSGGACIAVTEEEIVSARSALGRSGLDVEPTAAAALAGAIRWLGEGAEAAAREIDENGPPLIVLTGSGLKVAR